MSYLKQITKNTVKLSKFWNDEHENSFLLTLLTTQELYAERCHVTWVKPEE